MPTQSVLCTWEQNLSVGIQDLKKKMNTASFLMKEHRTSLQTSNNSLYFAVFLKKIVNSCDVKLVISWHLTLKFPIVRFVFLAN